MKASLVLLAGPLLLALGACAAEHTDAPTTMVPVHPATIVPLAPASASSTAAHPGAGTPPVTVGAPSLDRVLREAAAAHQPVLLDFGAAWCQPCAQLAAILADSESARPLAPFRVQFYEIDDGAEGTSAAERLGAKSVPMLVVLGPDGAEFDRETGEVDKVRVLKWIDDRARVAAGGPLSAARLANEKDALALLLGARAAERAGDADQARRLFVAARQADPRDAQGIGSEAEFALLRGRARDDTARDHGALLLAFARAYPASPWAVRAIAGIAALPTAARPRLVDIQVALRAMHAAIKVTNDWLTHLEHELGIAVTPTAPPATPFPRPVDPLVDAPALGNSIDTLPLDAKAMVRRDQAIGARVGKACTDAPRPREIRQEWVRVWVKDGAAVRVLLLNPEAEPALKLCVEQQVLQERDLPAAYGTVHDVSVHFAVTTAAK